MGECEIPFNLEEWIPGGFDIYAVGCEECMSICLLLLAEPV